MKLARFLLMVAGWVITVCAVALLGGASLARGGFVVAGLAVEVFGLALAVRSHFLKEGAE